MNEDNNENIIEINDFSLEYGKIPVLNNISLKVKKGTTLGLIGGNGAGKTTLINSILGLIGTKGSIKLFGDVVKKIPYEKKGKIGLIPQEISVVDNISVKRNMKFFGKLNGFYDEGEALKLMEDFNLDQLKDRKVKKLSGGQKKKLNIITGLVHKPELIIFDEPTAELDAISREKIIKKIIKMKEGDNTIIYTSHYLSEVEQVCDDYLLLENGHIIYNSLEYGEFSKSKEEKIYKLRSKIQEIVDVK